VETKREAALARPKKITLGPQCPICDVSFTKSTNREHVAWHFQAELREMVLSLHDPRSCAVCPYTSDKIENMAKHLALGHSKLDELMQNDDLVQQKRNEILSRPRKVALGPDCPICGLKMTKSNREHVAQHFIEELRDMVANFDDPNSCPHCPFQTDNRADNMAKHLALGHCKLDELLMDEELVEMKQRLVVSRGRKI